MRVLTTLLSKEEVGNYYLLLTVITLFSFAFFNPLGQYYGRHLIEWKNSKNLFNATVVLLVLRSMATALSLIIAIGIYKLLGFDSYCSISAFILFVLVSLVASTHGVLITAVNTLGDRLRFTIFMSLTLVLGLVLSFMIVFFIDESALGWLYGVAISQLIFSIVSFKFVVKNQEFSLKKMKCSFRKKYINKIAVFVLPVTVTLFLQWGQSQFYRFIVETKYSLEVLAFIGTGLAISGAIFSAVEGLATQFYNPIYLKQITNATKEDRGKVWNELAGYMIPIYFILAMYVIILAPCLTSLLVASTFHEAYTYVMFGAMIEFFRASTNLVYKVSLSEVKSTTTILPYSLGLFLTVFTLYFFDMSEDLWLIPFAVGMANFFVFIVLFYKMKKLLDIKIRYFNLSKSFVLMLPLCLIWFMPQGQSFVRIMLTTGISGAYFLFLVYLIAQKRILGRVT